MSAITINDLNNAKIDVDHIAEVATSLSPTATDRIGHTKRTVYGAVASIADIVNRGDWTTATAYGIKDVARQSGVWYRCVIAHTSAASFATDLAAARWVVHAGLTQEDLAYSGTAADIGTADGTLQDVLDRRNPYPAYVIGDESGINSTNLPRSLAANRNGGNSDQHVIIFGDSHAWGQGSPWGEPINDYSNVSIHSAHLYNRGVAARIQEWIERRYDTRTLVYQSAGGYAGRHMPGALRGAPYNATDVRPIVPVFGAVTTLSGLDVSGSNAFRPMYQPFARGDVTAQLMYRDKLMRGTFPRDRIQFVAETEATFDPRDKPHHFEFVPWPAATATSGYTQYTVSGVIAVERHTSSGNVYFYVARNSAAFPLGMVGVGKTLYIPGYGVVTIASVTGVGSGAATSIGIGVADVAAATKLSQCLSAGCKIFSGLYLSKQLYSLDMETPARAVYVSVRHMASPNSGTLKFFFLEPAGAVELVPWLHTSGSTWKKSAADSNFDWVSTNRIVHSVSSAGVLATSAKASLLPSDAEGAPIASIDTTQITGGTDEDVVYRIDLGTRMRGRLYIEVTGSPVIRGVIFGNNKVANCSMGAHTVGGWLGTEASFSDPAEDHLQDILDSTPARPGHCIVQIPFVNEYLRQTPIATFKANIQTLVSRVRAHLSGSNNFNLGSTDFLFFTTLRNRGIAFEAAASSAITYTAYVTAAREVCEADGHAFVDAEEKLMRLVDAGVIDYQRLYNDSNHPSDYANELLFLALEPHLLAAV